MLDTAKLTAKVMDSDTGETIRNGLSQLDELVFPELNPGGNEVLVFCKWCNLYGAYDTGKEQVGVMG